MTNKADAKAAFAQFADGLSHIAVLRRDAREHGLDLPEENQQQVADLRRLLREAGLSQEAIDATPGLERPN